MGIAKDGLNCIFFSLSGGCHFFHVAGLAAKHPQANLGVSLIWRLFGEKVFELFAFVVDPHHWNENAEDTQPLRGGENISCGGFALGNNHRRFCSRLVIFDYDSQSCSLSDSLASSRSFGVFCRLSGCTFWSHLLTRFSRRLRLRTLTGRLKKNI